MASNVLVTYPRLKTKRRPLRSWATCGRFGVSRRPPYLVSAVQFVKCCHEVPYIYIVSVYCLFLGTFLRHFLWHVRNMRGHMVSKCLNWPVPKHFRDFLNFGWFWHNLDFLVGYTEQLLIFTGVVEEKHVPLNMFIIWRYGWINAAISSFFGQGFGHLNPNRYMQMPCMH